MNIVFRADASIQIGTGHIMRCLTLADALKARGARCHFISREHPGNLNALVLQRGHSLSHLPLASERHIAHDGGPAHAGWLGSSWQTDASLTAAQLEVIQPDWLIVDHYALDHRWERRLAASCRQIMVIDDLADRQHDCDLLLDQSLGRQFQDYSGKVSTDCQWLLGPQFALLRPEFADLRAISLDRRKDAETRNLLISMGGGDQFNATARVMHRLRSMLNDRWNLQVVMGANAPEVSEVQTLALAMPCSTVVQVNVPHMADLMAEADIAIGAAGSTSWERCCLGLPTIMLILADNQLGIASQLRKIGAAALITSINEIEEQLPITLEQLSDKAQLRKMSSAAEGVTDGMGATRVASMLMKYSGAHFEQA